MPADETQSEKFKRVARERGCDENEARWNETVAKIAAQKPKPEQPE